VNDSIGNALAVYDGSHGGLLWSSNRVTAFGAVPGYRPLPTGTGGDTISVPIETAWRNRMAECIGYVWLGANWYDPISGQFLSPDPLGHDASTSLYSLCQGNPLGYWDADGRDGAPWFQTLFPATAAAAGARPYTGSLAGDLQVSGGFYGATLPIQAPGSIYTSQPFQRGMQVAGGATEAGVGAADFIGTSPTIAGSVVSAGPMLHGIDNIQAGLQGTPTFTEQGLISLGASPTWASVGNSALGIGLTLGSSFTRVPAATPTTTWTTGLPAGVGRTDAFGNMTLSSLGSDLDQAQVELHEDIHSLLSPPEGGIINTFRADTRMWLYQNSQFFRYTEEALAETTAQLGTRDASGLSFGDALMNGLRFPLDNAYGLSVGRIGLEAAGGATVLGGGIYAASQFSLDNSLPLGKKPH
jgi:RHS repeat-associated protein